MPTAIVDLELEHLPAVLTVPERCQNVLVLARWRRRPVGQVTLPVVRGQVAGDRLREAILEAAAGPIMEQWLYEYIEWEPVGTTPPPPATVAVCTRDRPDDLARCLTALGRLPNDGQEIVVVDSASRADDTRRIAEQAGVRYVREERPGAGIARNRAMREARNPVVAFTDDDAVPDPEWLRALLRNFTDPRVLGVTGFTMPIELETEAQEWFERTNGFGRGFNRIVFDGNYHDTFLVGRVGASVNLALRRDAIDLIGPFNEALGPGTRCKSGEDHDLFVRILAGGYTIVYEPEAVVWHRHRRDWKGLRDTIYGYGVGVYAYLTSQLLERHEAGAPRLAAAWLGDQIPRLVRALLRRPGHIPLDLAWAELQGCAAGPLAYLRSRRALRASVRR